MNVRLSASRGGRPPALFPLALGPPAVRTSEVPIRTMTRRPKQTALAVWLSAMAAAQIGSAAAPAADSGDAANRPLLAPVTREKRTQEGTAQERTTQERATQQETTHVWYAGQIGGVYAGSVALLLIAHGSSGGGFAPAAIGELGILLGPPIMHLAHKNTSALAASVVLRGLLIFTVVEWGRNCFELSTDSTGCQLLGAAAVAELVGIPIVDFAFAYETVARPATLLGLSLSPPSGNRPGFISVGGRF